MAGAIEMRVNGKDHTSMFDDFWTCITPTATAIFGHRSAPLGGLHCEE